LNKKDRCFLFFLIMYKFIIYSSFLVAIAYNCNVVSAQTKPTAKTNSKKQPKQVAGPNEPDMVYIQGSTFVMGNNDEFNEWPAHKVTVNDYYIGKYEVTVGEFRKFINATGYVTSAQTQGWSYVWDGTRTINQKGVTWECDAYGFKRNADQENRPVIYVSYADAVAYCQWLSGVTKKNYRLPTEAEWEYAAKGGNKFGKCNYSGSNIIEEVAWYKKNGNGQTHPVGQLKPNEIGIYDMCGNVAEWCADWYSEKYYTKKISANPQGPETGTTRSVRGGSWFSDAGYTRNSSRSGYDPNSSCGYNGFRLVKD